MLKQSRVQPAQGRRDRLAFYLRGRGNTTRLDSPWQLNMRFINRQVAAASGLCLALCLSCTSNRPPTAMQLRDEALAQAQREGKRAFILFVAADSDWSDRFEQFHLDQAARAVLNRHFVIRRIHFTETPDGDLLFGQSGSQGWPAFIILDDDGTYLATSGVGADNIGFPNTPEEVDRYFTALRAARPQLTEDEERTLREALQKLHVDMETK